MRIAESQKKLEFEIWVNSISVSLQLCWGTRGICVPVTTESKHARSSLMSALGQKQTFECASGMSALPPGADMAQRAKSPLLIGHSSGIVERTLADLALFVEPPELFLPLFAAA
jgi:hypothetical protein